MDGGLLVIVSLTGFIYHSLYHFLSEKVIPMVMTREFLDLSFW